MSDSDWLAFAASNMNNLAGNIGQIVEGSDQYYWYQRQRQDAFMDWNTQNMYNDPRNVMRRMQAAGVNPLLAVSNGAAAQPAGALHETNPQNISYDFGSGFAQLAQLLMSVSMNQKQRELIDSQIRLNDSKASESDSRALLNAIEQVFREGRNDWYLTRGLFGLIAEDKALSNANRSIDYERKDFNLGLDRENRDFLSKEYELNNDYTQSKINLNKASASHLGKLDERLMQIIGFDEATEEDRKLYVKLKTALLNDENEVNAATLQARIDKIIADSNLSKQKAAWFQNLENIKILGTIIKFVKMVGLSF